MLSTICITNLLRLNFYTVCHKFHSSTHSMMDVSIYAAFQCDPKQHAITNSESPAHVQQFAGHICPSDRHLAFLSQDAMESQPYNHTVPNNIRNQLARTYNAFPEWEHCRLFQFAANEMHLFASHLKDNYKLGYTVSFTDVIRLAKIYSDTLKSTGGKLFQFSYEHMQVETCMIIAGSLTVEFADAFKPNMTGASLV